MESRAALLNPWECRSRSGESKERRSTFKLKSSKASDGPQLSGASEPWRSSLVALCTMDC